MLVSHQDTSWKGIWARSKRRSVWKRDQRCYGEDEIANSPGDGWTRFRGEITAHCSAVGMLLLTASLDNMSIQHGTAKFVLSITKLTCLLRGG